jgi:hypothetical protein
MTSRWCTVLEQPGVDRADASVTHLLMSVSMVGGSATDEMSTQEMEEEAVAIKMVQLSTLSRWIWISERLRYLHIRTARHLVLYDATLQM